ncbi:MAG: FecR domain-containing protein [Treponema sp.]|nr:FecR domain-containing protein [Treponema sp.]
MNRIVKTLFVLTFGTACLLPMAAEDATVTSITGKVQIHNGTEWVALHTGDTISKGAVISTGFKSEAQLNIQGSILTLGPLTRTTIEQLTSNTAKDETKLFIDCGVISATVNKKEGKRVDFKVRSPAATASVRGTDFTMTASGTLITHEGLVSKLPPESGTAQVVESDEPTAFIPADGKSKATTSTKEISGSFGIPVFANQVSTTDNLSGISSTPLKEKVLQTQVTTSTTETLAQSESVTSITSDLTIQAIEPTSGNGAEAKATATITLSF